MKLIAQHDFVGIEFDWLASDQHGHIGLISLRLPIRCDAILQRVAGGYVGNWEDVAKRGVFGFDWRRETNSYRLIAAPGDALSSHELALDDRVRAIAAWTTLEIRFSACSGFDSRIQAIAR